ncbi:LLM class flavin-dependent oxidoreductase [Streptomyces sp. NPDC004166]
MELGILSLSDLQTDPTTGHLHDAARRTREIVSYAIAADQAGLDIFGLGEHHSPDFSVANPAIPLAAIAQATEHIRLTSAVSVLSTLDPVRLHQDFASLDHLSNGRTEIIAGRSAFLEAFTLFGVDPAHYDAVFAEKLDLLLAIRDNQRVTWSGRHRPALDDLPVPPRPQQQTLPLWLGVGGTPSSAERAARLGLPMVLGLIGGDIRRVRPSPSTTALSARPQVTHPRPCVWASPATSTSAGPLRAPAKISTPTTASTCAPRPPTDAAG